MRALFFVCSLYLGACSFCAVATVRRGALSSLATFTAVFIFAAFRSLLPRTFFRFPFSHFSRIVSRVHAGTFAVRLSKRFQGSFQTVVKRFKLVICFVLTFAPFVPFHALE